VFNFPPLSHPERSRRVERAVARVHARDAVNTDAHLGAATVVNASPLLLVTAGHVAPTSTVRVSFPHLGDGRLYAARVIDRADGRDGDATPPGERRDFAVLAIDNPPEAGIDALEVWLEEIDAEELHDFAAFGRNAPSLLWGGGRLTPSGSCAWRLRETAFNGDSGGAAVSQSGLLVGVVLDGREGGRFSDGAMGQATVLPLDCVETTLLRALDRAAPAGKVNVLAAERALLMGKLRPPPSAGWIDNLHYARGLRDLLADTALLKETKARGTLKCPLFKSVFERKLGWDLAARLVELASVSAKEAGDIFKALGDEARAEGREGAKRVYEAAALAYSRFVASRISGTAPPFRSADVSQALVGRAQSLLEIAAITGDDRAHAAAVSAAAQAASVAPPGALKGSALATLGTSAFRMEDYQTAIEAYSEASRNGFKPIWVEQDYAEAFRRRDNIVRPESAGDFEALGAYPGLSESKLRMLAVHPNKADKGTTGAIR
jgi:hypothetical protein